MNRLFSVKTTRNVLVPGWIVTFGFVALSAPPLGVAASVSLFVVGVVVVPALLAIPGPAGQRSGVVKGIPVQIFPVIVATPK
jgi:hypothetical protein